MGQYGFTNVTRDRDRQRKERLLIAPSSLTHWSSHRPMNKSIALEITQSNSNLFKRIRSEAELPTKIISITWSCHRSVVTFCAFSAFVRHALLRHPSYELRFLNWSPFQVSSGPFYIVFPLWSQLSPTYQPNMGRQLPKSIRLCFTVHSSCSACFSVIRIAHHLVIVTIISIDAI